MQYSKEKSRTKDRYGKDAILFGKILRYYVGVVTAGRLFSLVIVVFVLIVTGRKYPLGMTGKDTVAETTAVCRISEKSVSSLGNI